MADHRGVCFYNIVFWANFTAADEHFLSRCVVVRVALVQKFAPSVNMTSSDSNSSSSSIAVKVF